MKYSDLLGRSCNYHMRIHTVVLFADETNLKVPGLRKLSFSYLNELLKLLGMLI